MSQRFTVVHLVTSSDENDITHARAWEIPDETEADTAAKERLADSLTEAYGAPTEWIDDEPVSPSRAVFFEPGNS